MAVVSPDWHIDVVLTLSRWEREATERCRQRIAVMQKGELFTPELDYALTVCQASFTDGDHCNEQAIAA